MPPFVRTSSLLRFACVVVSVATGRVADASVSDDFGDGDDSSPPWSHFDPTLGATFDAASLSYLVSVSATENALEPARARSLREDASFGDVVVAADLVAFDDIADHAYGIVARATSSTAPAQNGYALVIRSPGAIALLQLDEPIATILATRPVTLSASTSYRLVLSVTGTGPALLTGALYAASDLANPIATVRYSDSQAPIPAAGFTGVLVADTGELQNQDSSSGFDAFFASSPSADTDADGLADGVELSIGTDPSDSDSDGDGLLDGLEIGTGVFAAQSTISTGADGARVVFAADLDGDGDSDVLSASYLDDTIAWYENDGTPLAGAWPERTISTAADGPRSVFAADVDGDGDTDVLSASFLDDKIAWYENDGTPASGAWTEYVISSAADGASSVLAADFDGDGDLDVLSGSLFVATFAWYENDGTPAVDAWTAHVIDTGAVALAAADVDGDGDSDVLNASYFDYVSWHTNDGTPAVGAWLEHELTPVAGNPRWVSSADFDGDGDTDVLARSVSNVIAWYENDGTPGTGSWAVHAISTATGTVSSAFAADVDGDGDSDVLATLESVNEVVWYENDGTPAVDAWTEHSISSAVSLPLSVVAADVDGDGDADALTASFFDDRIAWYPQRNAADPLDADTDDDGLLDGFEVTNGFDPLAAGDQALDPDGDGLTNLQEQTAGTNPSVPDTDGDGLGDGAEVNTYGTSPTLVDTDADGLLDGFEVANGFDPLVAGEEGLDPDSDGLTNLQEQSAGTNPALADSDGDGLLDGAEVNTHGTNPNLVDTDGDGLGDGVEVNVYGTSPILADTDGDAAQDGADNCPVTANPTQSDVGGVSGGPADGIGDACQCGDVDDDGSVDSADVVAYRDSLADPDGLPLTSAGVAKCSVIGSAGPCEILDVSVIQRALESEPLLPGIAQVCSAARGP